MSESKTSSPSGSKFDDVYEECLNDIDEYSPHAEDNVSKLMILINLILFFLRIILEEQDL